MPRGIAITLPSEYKTILIRCVLSTLGCFACAAGAAAEEAPRLTKLAEGIYARIVSPDGNAVANAGFVVLDQSVLVFDTHFTPEAGRDLLSEIRSVTTKPVRYVVNSHWHADHTHGNQVFRNANIIGCTRARTGVLQNDLPSINRTIGIVEKQLEELREALEKEGDSERIQDLLSRIKSREDYLNTMARQHILAPDATMDDGLTIQDGARRVRLLYLGKGHTDSDIALLLPSEKIAFVGDLFFNKAIPNAADACILDWMETLGKVLELDAEIFVPGHGPVGSKKDVESFLCYLKDLESLVKPAIERGETMQQAMEEIQMPAEYSMHMFQNFFPYNVQKMYEELKALQLSLESGEKDAE